MSARDSAAVIARQEPAAPPLGLAPSIFIDKPPIGGFGAETQTPPSIYLRGFRIHALTERQAISHVMSSLERGRGGWIITPNLDHLRRLTRDPEYRVLFDRATLAVADGMPLIWASRILGTPLPERVTGSNLISSLTEAAAEKGSSIYMLGGAPGTAERASEALCQRYPNLRITGQFCPEPGFENNPAQMDVITERLIEANPQIVYVALGSPKQERLIARLRDRLPGAWWLGIGISFSFVCGDVRRAPRWMQQTGMEWLHRMAQEPKRLVRRYLVEGLPFAASLLAGAAFDRLTGQRPQADGLAD